MAARTVSPRLADMIEAVERVRSKLDGVSLEAFETDWATRWLVERGLEIVSEASRHLPDEVKRRQTSVPWPKVAAIGNVLRHGYDRIAPDVLFKLARDDLPILEAACRIELAVALLRERGE